MENHRSFEDGESSQQKAPSRMKRGTDFIRLCFGRDRKNEDEIEEQKSKINEEKSEEQNNNERLPPPLGSIIFSKLLASYEFRDKQTAVRTCIEIAKQVQTVARIDHTDVLREIASIIRNQEITKDPLKEIYHTIQDENGDFNLRSDIAYIVGRFVDKNNIGDFANLLRNEQINFSVRGRIAEGIGDSGCKDVAGELLPVICNEEVSRFVREKTCQAIAKLGDKNSAAGLAHIFHDKKIDFEVRTMAGAAAVLLGKNDLADDLVPLLRSDKLPSDHSNYIARAIGESGRQDLAGTLVSELRDELINKGRRIKSENIIKVILMLNEKNSVSAIANLLPIMHSAIDRHNNFSGNISENPYKQLILDIGEHHCKIRRDKEHEIYRQSLRNNASTSYNMYNESIIKYEGDIKNKCHTIAQALGVPGCKNVAEHLVPLLCDSQFKADLHDQIAYSLIRIGDKTIIPSLKENPHYKKTGKYNNNIHENIEMVIMMLGEKSVEEIICDERIGLNMRIKMIDAIPHIADKSALPNLKNIVDEQKIDYLMRFKLSDSIEQLESKLQIQE